MTSVRRFARLLGVSALAPLALLLAYPTSAQNEQVIRIPTAEEEHEQHLAEGLETCSALDGLERTVCLTNLSLAARDARPCEQDPSGECGRLASRLAMNECHAAGSDTEKVLCQTGVATRYKNPDACEMAPKSELCLGTVAVERRDPAIITERVDDTETRDALLSTYATQTGDEEAIDHMEDNYGADITRIAARVDEAARSGQPLDSGFCWELRGNYAEVDTYVESSVDMQTLCHESVNEVNDLNRRLALAETAESKEAIRKELDQRIEKMDRQLDAHEVDFGIPENFELEEERALAEAADLPEPEEAEIEARSYRRIAEDRLGACDFAGARDAAEQLREALARMSESRGRRLDDPWLAMNYLDVVAAARNEQIFDRAMEAAQQAYDRALEEDNPTALDEAAHFAELAQPNANADCGEPALVDALLETIASMRKLLASLEEEAAEEEDLRDTHDADDEGDPDDGTGSGSWAQGHTVEVQDEAENDPCDGSRPEYAAAMRRVERAVQDQDRNRLAAAIAGLPHGCAGDAARLGEISDIAREIVEAETRSNIAGLQRDSARARAARHRTAAGWASALSTISGFVREAERWGASDTAAATSTAREPADGGAAKTSCRVDFGSAANAPGNQKGLLWLVVAQGTMSRNVTVMPMARGQSAPRSSPGVTTRGPYESLATAKRVAKDLCSGRVAPQ